MTTVVSITIVVAMTATAIGSWFHAISVKKIAEIMHVEVRNQRFVMLVLMEIKMSLLQNRIAEAIEEEDYELCSRLRSEIDSVRIMYDKLKYMKNESKDSKK